MKYARDFKNQELINKNGDLFLTIDSLIRITNEIKNLHNLHLSCHNVKPAGYNKQYMDVSRIEAVLCSLVDRFNNRRITPRAFCNTFLDKIHPFPDGNGRTCKILFDDKNFYKIFNKVTWFISYSDSFPDHCRILYQEMLFIQNYAVFLINMINKEYVFMLSVLFIDHVSRIINKANILTDGRWRCYNEMGICYRYDKL